MKVYFGFNDIRPDGMGSAAINLLTALRNKGILAQPVHPWKVIKIPKYYDFNPVFLSESSEMPEIGNCIKNMVDIINKDIDCSIFSHFGTSNWGAILPYLRHDIRVVISVHSVTPSAMKIALAYPQRVSKFVAVSWAVQKKLLKSLPEKDHWKVSLVPNAIDVLNYPVKSDFSIKNRCRIVYIGRIEDYTKGADKIPKIAKILKKAGLDFIWDFYGYFHWGYENRFYKELKRYEVEDVIYYKGCLTPDEIPQVVSDYDIMVMPSNHEGFGLSLIESMALGLTCIASRLTDVTDRIIDNGKNGFVVGRNDITGFANTIRKAANDKNLRMSIGENSRKKVEAFFSIQQHGESYAQVFKQALEDTSYHCAAPIYPLDNFYLSSRLKSHILARIIPVRIKRILKKII